MAAHRKQRKNERLRAILAGAFAGAPTPLKDIPTKAGESRAAAKRKPKPKRRRSKYA